MKSLFFALDLKNDPALIQEYLDWHQKVWPEVEESFEQTGIERVEIYHVEDRLIMCLTINKEFSFEKKREYDLSHEVIQKWESLMSTYQKPLPNTPKGEKWRLMNKVYSYSHYSDQSNY